MSTLSKKAPRSIHRGALAATLIAVTGMLAGCGSAADSYYGGEDSAAAPASADFFDDGGAAADSDLQSEGTSRSMPADRSVIITGSLYITVEDPIAAANQAAAIVQSAGGRIDARSETAPDERYGGSAELTLRIPSEHLDRVVGDLRELGTVDQFNTDSYDVTTEVTDLEARISTLRASTLRIQDLLLEASDISDIISLENELANRQADLESLEARQRGLDDQVSMSTINLSLTTEPVVVVDDSPESFIDGLLTGWNALVGFLSAALVVLGVLLPWLAMIAIVTVAIVAAARLRKARKAGRTTAAGPPPSVPAPPTQ